MSNRKPSSVHVFGFKLGMQLSQDAVFTMFWWNNSFTLTFITSPAFIDKYRVLSHSNLLQDGINPFGGDLSSCSCSVCCFGDYGCPLVLGFLVCDVSAPRSSHSLPFISPGDWQSTRKAERAQHLQPAFQFSPRIKLMWGYISRVLMTFFLSGTAAQCCYTSFTYIFVKVLCGNNNISNYLLHCVQLFV